MSGVVFQPMLFESLGGVSEEATGVIRSLTKVVACNNDSSVGEKLMQSCSKELTAKNSKPYTSSRPMYKSDSFSLLIVALILTTRKSKRRAYLRGVNSR